MNKADRIAFEELTRERDFYKRENEKLQAELEQIKSRTMTETDIELAVEDCERQCKKALAGLQATVVKLMKDGPPQGE